MITEMAVLVTAAMAFEVDFLIILIMIDRSALHEATAVCGVFFAVVQREVTPIKQWAPAMSAFYRC
jgi:hypothetical protein